MNRDSFRAGYILAGGVLSAMLAILLTHEFTKVRIAESQLEFKSKALLSVLPIGPYDNTPLEKAHSIQARSLSTSGPVEIYPLYKNGKPFAVALTLETPDGYNGTIRLLLGVNVDGTVIRSRVITHQETPGLGDDIDIQKSNWIDSFAGKSLSSVSNTQWAVKQEGGSFDGFTGATITPRAVIHAIHRALQWFRHNSNKVFIDAQD